MTKEEISANLRQAADCLDDGDLKMALRITSACQVSIEDLRFPPAQKVSIEGHGNVVIQTDGAGEVWINGKRMA